VNELAHLTLTTGHARRSPRSEVAPEIITKLRPIVAKGGGALWNTGFGVVVVERGQGSWIYDLSHEGVEAIRCYLVAEPDASDRMWQRASANHPNAVRPPTVPWLAVEILPDGVLYLASRMDIVQVMGDLERCVAWALLPRR